MKILNLYAGIGGNRKLWGNNHEITAVEINSEIAKIYSNFYPSDTVIIGDAHDYLLKHFQEFDFIWSSPPCQSHSRINKTGLRKKEYIDIKLYQEIIFLKQWYKGKFVIENVIPYYETLINPTVDIDRHYFWANFNIPKHEFERKTTIRKSQIPDYEKSLNYDLSKYTFKNKRQLLRNCVLPEIGEYILNRAIGIKKQQEFKTGSLF